MSDHTEVYGYCGNKCRVPVYSKEQTKEQIKEALKTLGMADYIVETGTDGIWTYEKWQSGKAVCYGYVTKEIETFTTWGNIFNSPTSIHADYPSGLFIDTPKCKAKIVQPIGSTSWLGYTGGGGNRNTTIEVNLCRGAGGSAGAVIEFEAIGAWK